MRSIRVDNVLALCRVIYHTDNIILHLRVSDITKQAGNTVISYYCVLHCRRCEILVFVVPEDRKERIERDTRARSLAHMRTGGRFEEHRTVPCGCGGVCTP